MAEEYIVVTDSAGYRTQGNVTQYARKGERLKLDPEQAERLLGLGAIRPVEEARQAAEAAGVPLEQTPPRHTGETVDADQAEQARQEVVDQTGQQPTADPPLTADRAYAMTVEQLRGYVDTHPAQRQHVAELERQRPESQQRKMVLRLGEEQGGQE